MVENIQWEYRIELVGSALRQPKPDQMEAFLNQVGLEGWEVVSLLQLHSNNKVWVTIKRPLTSSTRRQRTHPGEQW